MKLVKFSTKAIVDYSSESMEDFLSICETAIDKFPLNSQTKFLLKSAVNELLVNSLEHGYNKASGLISIDINYNSKDEIILELSDLGNGLDINSLSFIKPMGDYNSLTSSGWGLLILKELSSEMEIRPNTPTGTMVLLKVRI